MIIGCPAHHHGIRVGSPGTQADLGRRPDRAFNDSRLPPPAPGRAPGDPAMPHVRPSLSDGHNFNLVLVAGLPGIEVRYNTVPNRYWTFL
eukprot:757296-Hanusia_phi.AAC.1